MERTKVKEFSACQTEDINSLLSELGVKYVDLKVIQGRRTADASLLLVYKEDDSSPSSIGNWIWKNANRVSRHIPRSQDIEDAIIKDLPSHMDKVPSLPS